MDCDRESDKATIPAVSNSSPSTVNLCKGGRPFKGFCNRKSLPYLTFTVRISSVLLFDLCKWDGILIEASDLHKISNQYSARVDQIAKVSI